VEPWLLWINTPPTFLILKDCMPIIISLYASLFNRSCFYSSLLHSLALRAESLSQRIIIVVHGRVYTEDLKQPWAPGRGNLPRKKSLPSATTRPSNAGAAWERK